MVELCIYIIAIVLAIVCVSIYRNYSKKYADRLIVRLNDIKSDLNEDEKSWIDTHLQYLNVITEDKALCNCYKIKSKFLHDLEFATYCGLFSGNSYSSVYKAISEK